MPFRVHGDSNMNIVGFSHLIFNFNAFGEITKSAKVYPIYAFFAEQSMKS